MGGHGHGHDHHAAPYEVPDYKIYKVSDAPRLVELQKGLAARGLKDPWIRNEVWRFNEKVMPSKISQIKATFGTGFKYGFAAFVLTMLGTKLYERQYTDEHGHGDHH